MTKDALRFFELIWRVCCVSLRKQNIVHELLLVTLVEQPDLHTVSTRLKWAGLSWKTSQTGELLVGFGLLLFF